MENANRGRASSARRMESLPVMPVVTAELTRGRRPRCLAAAEEHAAGEAGELFIALAAMAPRAINKSVPLQSRIQKLFHELN